MERGETRVWSSVSTIAPFPLYPTSIQARSRSRCCGARLDCVLPLPPRPTSFLSDGVVRRQSPEKRDLGRGRRETEQKVDKASACYFVSVQPILLSARRRTRRVWARLAIDLGTAIPDDQGQRERRRQKERELGTTKIASFVAPFHARFVTEDRRGGS